MQSSTEAGGALATDDDLSGQGRTPAQRKRPLVTDSHPGSNPNSDTDDTIARLRSAAERRARSRRGRVEANASTHAEVEALETKLAALEARLTRQERDAIDAEQRHASELQAARDELAALRDSHGDAARERIGEVEALRSAAELAKAELAAAKSRADRADELVFRVQTLEAEEAQLRARLHARDAEGGKLAEAERRALDAEGRLEAAVQAVRDAAQGEIAEALNRAAGFEASAEGRRIDLERERARAEEAERRCEGLRAQLDAAMLRTEASAADAEQLRDELATLRSENEHRDSEHQHNLDRLVREVTEATQVALDHEQEIRALRIAVDDERERVAAAQRVAAEAEGRESNLRMGHQADMAELQSEFHAQLQAAADREQALRNEFEALRAAAEAQLDAHQDAEANEAELLREVELLRESRDALRVALDEVQTRAASVAPAEPSPAPSSALQEKVAQYEAEMQMASTIISNLESQCQSYETRISKLQEELRRHEVMQDFTANASPPLRAVRER